MSKAPNRKIDLSGAKLARPWNKIIIHHTATKRQKKYDVEWCRSLHKGKGWWDIGYHIYIEYDGSISLGRDLRKTGAHCRGQNVEAIGIAFVGGLNAKGEAECTLTDSQKKSIAVVIKALRDKSGKALPVFSHNKFRNTFCPGFDASEVDWESLLDDGASDTKSVSTTDK